MRHLFIINPAAGKKKSTALLERRLRSLSFAHEVAYTRKAGDARRITEEAAAVGEPVRIYACGGDGTLNEVVNGAAGHAHVAITCIPTGTGNDFLKIFGPDHSALFSDLERLAAGPQTAFDVMDCNGILGLDVVCAGVDARVAADVHKYTVGGVLHGKGAYIASLLVNVFFKKLALPLRVEVDGEVWDQDTTILCVCNGRYYGGGFMPVGEAMPDDGILDVLLVEKIGLLTFIRLVKKYAVGRYAELIPLVRPYHTTCLKASAPEPVTIVIDGEVLREREFTIRLSEKKVNFFYPSGASYLPRTISGRDQRKIGTRKP